MMNENSPICASPMPTRSEVRVSCPASSVPAVQVVTFPATTASVMNVIGTAYSSSSFGSMSMPMATKNTAANMSRTGAVRCSMRPRSREAPRENGDEQHRVAVEAGDVAQEPGNREQPEDERDDEEDGETSGSFQ